MVIQPKSFAEQLKQRRREKEEGYSRVIMEPPTPTTILKSMPFPGVILIMGTRRYGKTGVAHEIGAQMHKARGVPVMVHLPKTTPEALRRQIQRLLPPWAKVTTDKKDWEKNSVVIYDEAAQSAHARRTQSGDAVELDNLIGVSGQRNQLLAFISHHSKKLDPNVVREVNRIIWKRPTYAYQLFERDELADYVMKAYDYFSDLRKGKPLTETMKTTLRRANLMLDMDDFRFLSFTNKLPEYWTEQLSCLFEDISKINRSAPGY